jgi:glycosyltransferase involved in cell wall biosynthesis
MNLSVPHNDNPTNILHIVNDRSVLAGGAGVVALEMSRAQRKLGHNATIWSIDSQEEHDQAVSQNIVEGQPDLTIFRTFGPKSLGYSPSMEKAAVNEIGGGYQILHQHSIWLAVSRVTNNWRSKFDRPAVISLHGTLEDFALKRSNWKKQLALIAYEMKNLKSASCLQATAEQEAARFRRFGLKNPIAIIPNGISEDWFQCDGDVQKFRERFSISGERRLLLFLSRIHPVKGLPMLFEAMAQLSDRLDDWLLVIAGPDESGHQHELEQQREKLGLSNRVIFAGPLHGAEKRDAFAAADVFVLPTHSENFGIVIAEALGAGVPVITTRGAPWADLQTYQCGWWVDASVDAIREALLEATQCPKEELVAMGQRGRMLVSEKYTWPKVAEQSIQLYKWLLGQEPRPGFVVTD